MKKVYGSLVLLFCALCMGSSAQNIELDWKDFVDKRKDIPVTGSLAADDGIIINSVPAPTDIRKVVLSVNGTVVPQSTQPVNSGQVYFDNLGTRLNSLPAAATVEVILTNDAVEVGRVTLKKGGAATATGQPANPGTATHKDYENAVRAKYGLKLQSGVIKYNSKINQAREKNIIHIFLDEKGNFHNSSLPTTAREDNLFVFHLFYEVRADAQFRMEYEGVFAPTLEVYGSEPLTQDVTRTNSTTKKQEVVKISEQTFGPIGPFTGSVKVKITHVGKGTVILEKAITIAKLHHITLNAGLYGTFLRNPQNIAIFEKDNGEQTLVADDPDTRGFVTIMLTFYPKPRNILYPSTNLMERIGFTVGTSISKKLDENFFGGVSYDIARGLAITGGVHYGRVAHVVDLPNFDFGEDVFTGLLENRVKQKWDIGFYVGLNMDFRLLTFIFNQAGTNP